jgi:hypothetical protein
MKQLSDTPDANAKEETIMWDEGQPAKETSPSQSRQGLHDDVKNATFVDIPQNEAQVVRVQQMRSDYTTSKHKKILCTP